jgi:hypothetical protein
LPRPDQTPPIDFHSTGYDTAQEANDLADQFPIDSGEPDYVPANEQEKFLFGPTDRPNEPITAGAPFGAGPAFPSSGFESDEALLSRVAQQIGTTPGAPAELRAFAARQAKGL